MNTKKNTKRLLSPGHRACAGCGQLIAARLVAEAAGPETIIANATGCLEVVTTPYPESSWGVPWIHSLFENSAAIASGIKAALDHQSKITKVIAQGGDGATFDIGFGLISGMWERKDSILYVCYDNEAYMNTGIQASGATPKTANTTTTPLGSNSSGSKQRKKDMITIALAHGLNYVAQTTIGYPADITAKVKKALAVDGPSYLQILVPCVPGWKIKSNQALNLGKLAAQTGLYPLLEYENGQLANTLKVPSSPPKVEEYLKLQGRFKHLFSDTGKGESGKQQIKYIQQKANENIKKYRLK